MDKKNKHEQPYNDNVLKETTKFGNLMLEIIQSRTDKTEQQKDELWRRKNKELDYIIFYISKIIIGDRETFDNHSDNIYSNYTAEYIVISKIWADKDPAHWKIYNHNRRIYERYNQNREIFEANFGKQSKQIDKKLGGASAKGGEAGSVPRTYSMGAQPPPLKLPLDKEPINMEGNKVRSPEICQIDGPMDATNENIESPNSSEDESSGKPIKNNENSKKKTLKRKKVIMERTKVYLASVFFFFTVTSAMTQIAGILQSCPHEGERVPVDSIVKGGCFSCVCKNGYVSCDNGCPKTEGCHMLVEQGCCKRCKGCIYNGIYHPSDTEWMDKSSPCIIMRCEAGVITVSELLCYTPCANPLPPEPGKCCATCPECKMNDQLVTDDRDVTSDDPCLKCRCSGLKMTCAKKACPVLQCTPKRQIHPPGECCPRCEGTRALLPLKDTCTLQTSFFRKGDTFSTDKCTNCTCQNDTSICRRHTCPILDCAPDLQKSVLGTCCKICELPEEFASSCYHNGVTYQDGQQWKLDACKSCICQRGMPSCAITRCNTTSVACADGSRLVRLPGDCCPKCVEVEAACMVFGDPHYKTFDGSIYSFKGIGKYQLVADCIDHTFSVRVANAVMEGSSSMTKRVAIRYLNVRINLQQKGRIKYNGTIVKAPFKVDGKFRAEKKEENAVEIVLNNGVKVFWNFRSFVEVIAPPTLKDKVCGLCGTFNHAVQDDLTTRSGRVVSDKEILAFGASWCIGKKSDCEKKIKQHRPDKPAKKNSCRLIDSDIFSPCHSKLNYKKYYRACKMDMEHCHKSNKCYCDSLLAYARECERLGVGLLNWQKYTFCDQNNLRRRKKKQHKSHRHQEAQLFRQLPKNLNRTRSSKSPVRLI
ncbi:hypothetical protein JTB14_037690 [Gonioctena quinquepunctata]|nr:hypothetical protein JTB14_037690 [Gonioctena quinquepunctata]